ncbi:hypothetical protein IFM89_034866 [Coptis chinensis]|uniref:ABC transmembrane type-1 domain-containing protein n=1 Tax=Coptis chinensis TaxID=261450 RepID=A0A835I9B4_9MAGN|nr:hypothetical protein IFM89_034866 [Coptis chinensis]
MHFISTFQVLHPKNLFAPTLHFNYRYFETDAPKGTLFALLYYYSNLYFPWICVNEFVAHIPRFMDEAITYVEVSFCLQHRGERRGLGGIFFDDLNNYDQEMLLGFATEGYCWSRTSERQVLQIRYKYLEAVLRQEVAFFDSQEATTSEIINSISKDTSLIQEVLSEKVPIFLMHTSVFMSGLAFSIYFSWRLALVSLPLMILLIISGLIYGKYLIYLSKKSYKEYSKANTIVEQALSSIKTVYSFTAERRIVERYSVILDRTVILH